MKNKTEVARMGALLSLSLVLLSGTAAAAPVTSTASAGSITASVAPITVAVEVINGTSEPLSLVAASWQLEAASPSDYNIGSGDTAEFVMGQQDTRKGSLSFSYSSGNKTCQFSTGHDLQESFGLFTSTKTPYKWVKAKSTGSFLANCEARVLEGQRSTERYAVEFSME